MKKTVSIILLLNICLLIFAQTVTQKNLWLGTKTTYVPLQKNYTPAPSGFTPVFMNHVGRHGARFQTKAGTDVDLLNMLSMANAQQALTPKGIQLLGMINVLVEIQKNNYGNISLSGADEQTGIGNRMFTNFPSVFKGNNIDISITQEIRTQQSCQAFLKGFGNYNTNNFKIKAPEKDVNNNELRFFDISPNYKIFEKEGNWKQQVAVLKTDKNIETLYYTIAQPFFTTDFFNLLTQKQLTYTNKKGKESKFDADIFTNDLYAVYSISYSLKKELAAKNIQPSDMDFSVFFSEKQLDLLDKINDADEFLKKGPGTCNTCLQVTDAVPLLVNFINTTDNYIKTKSKDAVLRFAHAETIAPFAALLEINGASESTTNINSYHAVWNASKIIPLSANIQMIVYNTPNEYFIKMLFNEKEVQLPLKAVNGCYYTWNAVRAYYMAKLKTMHVGLQDDMHQYLVNLK